MESETNGIILDVFRELKTGVMDDLGVQWTLVKSPADQVYLFQGRFADCYTSYKLPYKSMELSAQSGGNEMARILRAIKVTLMRGLAIQLSQGAT